MPLYEFSCDNGHREEHWLEVHARDSRKGRKCGCGEELRRLPGGHGMLFFEEGRGRVHIGLSDKPITSYAQRAKLMKAAGVTECNGTVPPSILKAGAKSDAMKAYLAKDKKGRWL